MLLLIKQLILVLDNFCAYQILQKVVGCCGSCSILIFLEGLSFTPHPDFLVTCRCFFEQVSVIFFEKKECYTTVSKSFDRITE